ncbi:MAG: LexA family transcriptional regulator [Bacilli bacterium]|jgi:repressor LexA
MSLFSVRLKKLVGDSPLREIAQKTGVSAASLSLYINGKRTPSMAAIDALSEYFRVSTDFLIGKEILLPESVTVPNESAALNSMTTCGPTSKHDDLSNMLFPKNLSVYDPAIQKYKVKVAGKVSAGGEQYSTILFDDYVGVIDTEQLVDYALRVKGDSMEPRLYDGDIVLIKELPVNELKDGNIIVIVINGEEGLVKRVYFEEGEGLVLKSENSAYTPRFIPFNRIGMDCFIVGKVVEIHSFPK